MAVTAKLSNGNGAFGEIREYTVTESATPLIAGDTSGSVGDIQVQARALTEGPIFKRSGAAIGDQLQLLDDTSIENTAVRGRGTTTGTITDISMPGAMANITAATLLGALNTDRTADAYYGSKQPESIQYVTRTNLSTNPGRETSLNGITLRAVTNGGAALTRPTSGGFDGGAYARYTASNTHPAAGGGVIETVTIPNGDAAYTVSTYTRVTRATPPASVAGQPGIAQRMRLVLQWRTSAGVQIGSEVTYEQVVRQGVWTRLVISAQAPPNAVRIDITTQAWTGTNYGAWVNGDTLDTDAVLAEQGPLGEYFSGAGAISAPTARGVAKTYAWTGTVGNSTSTETTAVTVPESGYDATQGGYFRYLCSLCGVYNVQVDPEFDRKPVAYPGFTGNVWNYIKQFTVATRSEVALVNDTVVLRKPRTFTLPSEVLTTPTIAVSTSDTAQFVEVYNYNSRWTNNEVIYKADTVYTVDLYGVFSTEIKVDHFLGSVSSPLAVTYSNFADNYTVGQGQYTVIDSQGKEVDPSWWNSSGAKVQTSLLDPNTVQLVIIGPKASTSAYLGPYRIGRTTTEDTAALMLTGSGVIIDKQPVRVRTAASARLAKTEVGSTIDNLYLSNSTLAYAAALDAACLSAGPTVTVSASIAYNPTSAGQEFGTLAGGRFIYNNNIFRITDVRYTASQIQLSGVADMAFYDIIDLLAYTFADFNLANFGVTFAVFNTAQSGKTFAQYNAGLPQATFTTFNTIFDGATFVDHAVYPYTGAPIGPVSEF